MNLTINNQLITLSDLRQAWLEPVTVDLGDEARRRIAESNELVDDVVAPDQALSREAAMLALTRWPARFIGASDSLGSIEVGKLADLVVFDGNIMDVPIEKLPDLLPVLTLVGGKVAYESDLL